LAEERVQKILARAGLGARRKCEEIIAAGRVTVNGEIIEIGAKADSESDEIMVDGKRLRGSEPVMYVAFNKPVGYITSVKDNWSRPTVMDFFRDFPVRLFPVGRLDFDTEGLLLLTNDGDFGQKVLHPSHKVFKTYHAVVMGVPDESALQMLRKGVVLRDGKTAPAKVRLIGKEDVIMPAEKGGGKTKNISAGVVEISIREGRKRQVRLMLKKVGHEVLKLKRIRIGSVELPDIPEGEWVELTAQEAEKALVDIE